MIRNLTWPQVAILIACLAATLAAYKFLGPDAGSISAVVSTVLAFLLGRDPSPPAPPGPTDGAPTLKLLTGGAASAAALLAAMFVSGCLAAHTSDAKYATELAACASTAPSKQASKACRAEVDRRWNVNINDAGAE